MTQIGPPPHGPAHPPSAAQPSSSRNDRATSETVLIVDDEEGILRAVSKLLRREGYGVRTANAAEIALDDLSRRACDVALVDLQMPGASGLEFLEQMSHRHPDIPVIIMSGSGTISHAVEAMRFGAVDFVEKPVQPLRLTACIRKALDHASLQRRHERLLEDIGAQRKLIGSSEAMARLRRLINRVACTDARVLILGENGTGKELIASALHEVSPRASHPFIKLNCSALPEHLLESELFGHERGAFTGAHARRRGRFELANRGTLFLDEVGDMPLSMQAKILRALQEGEFERVGGAETVRVDVRVVAATNKDIVQMVAEGSFREDLYYRLNVFTLRPPPLRERFGDIPELVEHLLSQRGVHSRLTPAAMQRLESHPFLGNVRELQNIIERLLIMSDGPTIGRDDVEAALPAAPPKVAPPVRKQVAPSASPSVNVPRPEASGAANEQPESHTFRSLQEFERHRIMVALQQTKGRRGEAAELLGMSRSTLWRRVKALGLD